MFRSAHPDNQDKTSTPLNLGLLLPSTGLNVRPFTTSTLSLGLTSERRQRRIYRTNGPVARVTIQSILTNVLLREKNS